MMTQIDPTLSSELIEESKPIEFPAGLIGLEEWKHFILLTHPAGGLLFLLQSLDEARLSFIVADPRQFIPEYQLSLSETDLQALQFSGLDEMTWLDPVRTGVYCILSVQEEPFKVTANLLGPLVINWQTGFGRQVILSNSGYNSCFLIAGNPSVEGLNF